MSTQILIGELVAAPTENSHAPRSEKLNNLVAVLLDVVPTSSTRAFALVRPSDGWIHISFTTRGEGAFRLTLDKGLAGETEFNPAPGTGPTYEAMQHVTKGQHTLRIERSGSSSLAHLTVKAIRN